MHLAVEFNGNQVAYWHYLAYALNSNFSTKILTYNYGEIGHISKKS